MPWIVGIKVLAIVCALTWTAVLDIDKVLAETSTATQPIQIGVSLPLTGDLMEYGRSVMNGIELARSKFPERFGKLRLLFEDNKYEADDALSALQKFRMHKVDAIYCWGEPPLNAIAPIVERGRIPVIAMSLDARPARGKKYILRSINSPKELISPVLSYLRQRGFKRLGVIKSDDPYDNAFVDALREGLRESETVTVIGTTLPEEIDFRAYAIRARNAPVDALGLYLYPSQVSALYRQLGIIGAGIPSFGTDVFESHQVITAAGRAMEGAVYPNLSMPKWFVEEYITNFGDDTQIPYAFNGYAWAAITADLFSRISHHPGADEIMKLYTSVLGSEGGVDFRYHATPDGDRYWEFPVVLKTIKNRQFVTVE
jgi:ABC-type branched-subunit amino acid transport system substrate-binding protein